ncbi:MAG: hypothetical protein AB4062_05225 [Crocosphaera sp.]
MFKYFLSMTALMVSVAGIGVSLAREEFRCYLGLISPECNPSAIKSISPMPIETKFEQKATQDNLEQSTPLTAKSTNSLEKNHFQERENNLTIKQRGDTDTNFISVEELSRIPETNFDNSVPSGEEGYVGIPIEVQPFNEDNN